MIFLLTSLLFTFYGIKLILFRLRIKMGCYKSKDLQSFTSDMSDGTILKGVTELK